MDVLATPKRNNKGKDVVYASSRDESRSSALITGPDGSVIGISESRVEETFEQTNTTITRGIDSAVTSQLDTLNKSRSIAKMALNEMTAEIKRLQVQVASLEEDCERHWKDMDSLQGQLAAANLAAASYRAVHTEALHVVSSVCESVEGLEAASCADLLRLLKAAHKKLLDVSSKPSPVAKASEGKGGHIDDAPMWGWARASDANTWSSSLMARERRLLNLVSDWKLLQTRERELAGRESEVAAQYRQCTEMLERIRVSREKLKQREAEVTRREGEVAARETEMDLRAADLEVFRAMLVDQEDFVKDLGGSVRCQVESVAETARLSMSRSQANSMPQLIPAGFTTNVTTDEDGVSRSTVQVQFVDVQTGEVIGGDSQVVSGSAINITNLTPEGQVVVVPTRRQSSESVLPVERTPFTDAHAITRAETSSPTAFATPSVDVPPLSFGDVSGDSGGGSTTFRASAGLVQTPADARSRDESSVLTMERMMRELAYRAQRLATKTNTPRGSDADLSVPSSRQVVEGEEQPSSVSSSVSRTVSSVAAEDSPVTSAIKSATASSDPPAKSPRKSGKNKHRK